MDYEWISAPEAARRLGVGLRTVYGFINAGDLIAYTMGRDLRVKSTGLAAFIEASRIAPGELTEPK